MRRLYVWALGGAIVFASVLVFMLIGTRGDYRVLPLVTEDQSLPSKTIAGVRLHMRIVDGPPDAPTVIVLHGGPGGDFRSLQALESLSNHFNVVFYDQRGAGLSERVSAEQLTLKVHLSELSAVVHQVSPDRPAVLIGHSWGAILAAAFLGQHPRRVKAAILIEPGYLNDSGLTAWRQQSNRFRSGLPYFREAILSGFRAQHVNGPDPNARDDFLIGHMVRVFANHPNNPYHCGGGYSAPSWRFGSLANAVWDKAPAGTVSEATANTPAYAGPVLFMAGACNAWTGAALQKDHMAKFSDARLHVVPEAGHDVIWDNPDASLAAIRDFLGAK